MEGNKPSYPAVVTFLGTFQNSDLPLVPTRFLLNKLARCWSRSEPLCKMLLAVLSTQSTNINYPVSYLSWKHCAGSLSGHISRGSGRSLREGGGEDMNAWSFMKTMPDFGQEQVVLNFNHSCYLFCFSQKSCSSGAPGNCVHNKPIGCSKEP